ncbi:MAG: hypothetical protein AAF984_08605 [Verrucomicrobiota bacterium]
MAQLLRGVKEHSRETRVPELAEAPWYKFSLKLKRQVYVGRTAYRG